MSLVGKLSTMPLPDVLQWIDSTRVTGKLTVHTPDFSTTLVVKEGRIISSSSTDPTSYLGQFLLAHTALTEEQLRVAFEKQEETKVYLGKNIFIKTMLGKILLDQGICTEEEITRVLQLKAEETVYDLFLCRHGTFAFEPGELPPEELVPMSLDIVLVLNRGIQRVAEWQQVRLRIPSNNAVFRLNRDQIPPDYAFDELGLKLLPLLEEGRSLRECTLRLHSTGYAVNFLAYRFSQQGFLILDGEVEAEPEPPRGEPVSIAKLVEQGQLLYDQRAFEDTLITARQALREDPAHQTARSLAELSEQQLTDSFYTKVCGPRDIPSLSAPLGQLNTSELSAEERFLLERVNGSWSIGDIVRLSPLREVDALVIFKKLLDDGLLRIRRN